MDRKLKVSTFAKLAQQYWRLKPEVSVTLTSTSSNHGNSIVQGDSHGRMPPPIVATGRVRAGIAKFSSTVVDNATDESITASAKASLPRASWDDGLATVYVRVPITVSPNDTLLDLSVKLRTAVHSGTLSGTSFTHNDGKPLASRCRLGDSLNPGETVDATPDTQSTPLDLARAQLDELTEQHVAAQKEALGPKFIAKSDIALQVDERSAQLSKILERLDTGDLPLEKAECTNFVTRMEAELGELRARLDHVESDFDQALKQYRALQRQLVRRISIPMQRKTEEYGAVLEAAEPLPIAEVNRVVEQCTNTGLLSVGDAVEVVQDGRFTPAMVNAVVGENLYELLVETEELVNTERYARTFSNPVVCDRSQIYTKQAHVCQPPPGQIADALMAERTPSLCAADVDVGRRVTTLDPEYLAELIVTAETLRPRLYHTVHSALTGAEMLTGVTIEVGPLKKAGRITQKAAGKYGGDYSKVLDLARLTVVCNDFSVLVKAFGRVVTIKDFTPVRVKNRLHKAFDVSASAGYRDILVNLKDGKTSHVCEVQLTVRGFAAAKAGGGHAMYKQLRLVGRLDPISSVHRGLADNNADVGSLADGAYAAWIDSGSSASSVIRDLVPSLMAPRCYLTRLVLNAVTGLTTLADTVLTYEVLDQLSPSLEELVVTHCVAVGPIPPGIQRCTRLCRLDLRFNALSQSIPPWLGTLANLEFVHLGSNALSGEIPNELSSLIRLIEFHAYGNSLEGAIPTWISQWPKMKILDLSKNRLVGPIPASLCALVHTTHLYLNDNGLRGELPSRLGDLTQLLRLHLSDNKLCGPIPSTIGQLARLRRLNLMNNEFSGDLPNSIGSLAQLTMLSLSNNQFCGVLPTSLTKLSLLQSAYLHDNNFVDPVPNGLCELPRLRKLWIHNTCIKEQLSEEFERLGKPI